MMDVEAKAKVDDLEDIPLNNQCVNFAVETP